MVLDELDRRESLLAEKFADELRFLPRESRRADVDYWGKKMARMARDTFVPGSHDRGDGE